MKKLTVCLLLLTLLLCGCNREPDLTNAVPVLDHEAITDVADLTCSIYDSESVETRALTGERVYELYRLLSVAVIEAEDDPEKLPPYPYEESCASVTFYTEAAETDLPETTAEGFTVSKKSYYGSFGVFQSGYLTFSLSPLHSHAYDYMGEAGLYEDMMEYCGE